MPPPAKQIAIVTCMHARLRAPMACWHSTRGRCAHLIRNVGGVITDEGEIRSLMISQRLLGTREVAPIHRTECCEMLTFCEEEEEEEEEKGRIQEGVGIEPLFALESFTHLEERTCAASGVKAHREASPFVPHKETALAGSSMRYRPGACASLLKIAPAAIATSSQSSFRCTAPVQYPTCSTVRIRGQLVLCVRCVHTQLS
jgi:carbonic anhydrase